MTGTFGITALLIHVLAVFCFHVEEHFIEHEIEKILICTQQLHQFLPFYLRKSFDFLRSTCLYYFHVCLKKLRLLPTFPLILKIHPYEFLS